MTIQQRATRALSVQGTLPAGSPQVATKNLDRQPATGFGLRDLTFAAALADAADNMLGASDLTELWAAIVSEAVSLISAETAALIEYRKPRWRLLASRPSSTHPVSAATTATVDDIAALGDHGLLDEPGDVIKLLTHAAAERFAWSASMIGRLTGLSSKSPVRLIWFARSPAAFSGSTDVAHVFVRHVDLALQSVATRDTLQYAVSARHRVGLAQGILMSRHQLTAAQAFALLQQRSQHSNVKLRSVADQVIETGELLGYSPPSTRRLPRGTP